MGRKQDHARVGRTPPRGRHDDSAPVSNASQGASMTGPNGSAENGADTDGYPHIPFARGNGTLRKSCQEAGGRSESNHGRNQRLRTVGAMSVQPSPKKWMGQSFRS
jgi:hypothetical protein